MSEYGCEQQCSNCSFSATVVDNVFIRTMTLPEVGDKVDGHSHPYDHITLLTNGAVLMKAKGEEKAYKAPHIIVTPKDIEHEFTALEDGTMLYCIHAIRDGHGVDAVASESISMSKALDLLKKYPVAVE